MMTGQWPDRPLKTNSFSMSESLQNWIYSFNASRFLMDILHKQWEFIMLDVPQHLQQAWQTMHLKHKRNMVGNLFSACQFVKSLDKESMQNICSVTERHCIRPSRCIWSCYQLSIELNFTLQPITVDKQNTRQLGGGGRTPREIQDMMERAANEMNFIFINI